MLDLNGSANAPSPNEIEKEQKSAGKLAGNLIIAALLKTTELELNRRGLLPMPDPDLFHPFWFVVETECNIFLWRRGLSLASAENFEFWINIDELAAKRIRQLESQSENPFTNPLWELQRKVSETMRTDTMDCDITRGEREYILRFQELMKAIEVHAAALSRVGKILGNRCSQKSAVVLPETSLRKS